MGSWSDQADAALSIGVDQGVNLKVLEQLKREGVILLFQAHDLEQIFRVAKRQSRPFRLDVSELNGPDRLASDNFYVVEALIGKENFADIEHVYASWLCRNDYFLTENPDDFIRDGRREKLEAALPGLKIRRMAEFLQEMGVGGQARR